MSKHPGASVFGPAGPRRWVPLALSCTDAVPHAGGKSQSPYTGSVIWPSCSITLAAAPPETLQHFQVLFPALKWKKKERKKLRTSFSRVKANTTQRNHCDPSQNSFCCEEGQSSHWVTRKHTHAHTHLLKLSHKELNGSLAPFLPDTSTLPVQHVQLLKKRQHPPLTSSLHQVCVCVHVSVCLWLCVEVPLPHCASDRPAPFAQRQSRGLQGCTTNARWFPSSNYFCWAPLFYFHFHLLFIFKLYLEAKLSTHQGEADIHRSVLWQRPVWQHITFWRGWAKERGRKKNASTKSVK